MNAPDPMAVVERLAFTSPFYLGVPKATGAVSRLGLTLEDLEAWEKERMPLRRLLWAVQRFKTPKDLQAYVARLEADLERPEALPCPEERREAILRARTLEELKQAEYARRLASPPPQEYYQALEALKATARSSQPMHEGAGKTEEHLPMVQGDDEA